MDKRVLIFFVILVSVFLFVSACSEDAVGRSTPAQQKYLQTNVYCVDSDFDYINITDQYFKKTTVSYTLRGKSFSSTDTCVIISNSTSNVGKDNVVSDCVDPGLVPGLICAVKEYYCAGSYKIDSSYYPCEYGCSNGECLKRKGCTEYTSQSTCIRDPICTWQYKRGQITRPTGGEYECIYGCTEYNGLKDACIQDSRCNWYDATKQCGLKAGATAR